MLTSLPPHQSFTPRKTAGAIGLDPSGQAYEESGRCSGITGRWIMSDLIEDSALAAFGRYFPN